MKFLRQIYKFASSWTGTIIIVLFVIFFIAQAFVIPSGSMKNTLLIGEHIFVKKFSYGIPTPHIPWVEIPVLPDFNGNGHLVEGQKPKRGDIVVFRYPLDPKLHFVKRNFALGGDEIIFVPGALYLRPFEGDDFIKSNYKNDDIFTLNGKNFVKEPYKFKGIHYKNAQDKDNFGITDRNTFDIALYHLEHKSKFPNFPMSPIFIEELGSEAGFYYDGKFYNALFYKVPKGEFFMIGDNRENSSDSRFWGSVDYKFIVGKPWFIYLSWDSKFRIRWERVGRFVDTLENDERFIREQP